jgi:hypothetical protein
MGVIGRVRGAVGGVLVWLLWGFKVGFLIGVKGLGLGLGV